MSFNKMNNIAGWMAFALVTAVYYFSIESSVSLWDCGEFVSASYKLQVVHPPGAPLFLLVARLFAWVGDILSDDPSNIARAVNFMSALLTAFMAGFIAWSAGIFTKMALVGREKEPSKTEGLIAAGSGLVAGLTSAFVSSVWFSAVEGEVYAMSSFFTAAAFWAVVKWYNLPKDIKHDRYLILSIYLIGLSIGVHLLSLLTLPAIGILYYLKKYDKPSIKGMAIAFFGGGIIIGLLQKLLISGLPWLWAKFDFFAVNTLGMPFNSGLLFVVLLLGGLIYMGFKYAHKKQSEIIQLIMVSVTLLILSYSVYGMVIIRANAGPPINMSAPIDAVRLLPYLNREQYGERPLLYGPHYEAQPIGTESTPKYGKVGDRYEIVDNKLTYKYKSSDKMLFPRISHTDQGRPDIYRQWNTSRNKKPTMAFNISFFLRYQLGWMYWRYFMWNFVGRENGEQGFAPWNLKSGNWYSGITPIDEMRLYNESHMPKYMRENPSRNRYYFIPLILGLLGMWFHFKRKPKEFAALMALFIVTGIGIIIYTNEPPQEPRERDYALAASFFTFAIWVGMGAAAIYSLLKEKLNKANTGTVALSVGLALLAPVILVTQNFDDHSRRGHYAARDYAINFLESVSPDAVIFTYGDNDTYPLWYAQEVEGIRRDVRVINLSLIAVDWYIDAMRRKVNDSPPIKFTIPKAAYRGNKRNVVLFPENLVGKENEWPIKKVLKFIGEKHPISAGGGDQYESYLPTRKIYIPVDKRKAIQMGIVSPNDSNIVDRIPLNITKKRYLRKDELAVMDIIGSNIWDRPIYFSVTTRPSQFLVNKDYMQLEGLALRIVPKRTPSQRGMGIFGTGGMDTDLAYDRIMHKFRWGNFDKMKTFVDHSYGAGVQANRFVMLRLAMELVNKGQKKKAADIVKKYFEAFPDMNFRYGAQVVPFLNILAQTGDTEALQKHLDILLRNLEEDLTFYNSLGPDELPSFQQDKQMAQSALRDADRLLQFLGKDAEINKQHTDKIKKLLGK